MEQRDSIERLAKLEMTTDHHNKRLTILEDERREWSTRIQDLSIATARLVVTSENLLASSKQQEEKIGLLVSAKEKIAGYFAGAVAVISVIWAAIVKFIS